MKSFVLTAVIGLAMTGIAPLASADCAAPWTRLTTKARISGFLEGKTVCVGTAPSFQAQEFHQSGGPLIDYKCGSGHAVDPTKTIGTWSATGSDGRGVFVTYDYGRGNVFTYAVWLKNAGDPLSDVAFCSANPEVRATVKSGQVPCSQSLPPECRVRP